MGKKNLVYVIYDGRYYTDPDRCTILSTAGDLDGARNEAKAYGDAVIVEHEEVGNNWNFIRVIEAARPAPAGTKEEV